MPRTTDTNLNRRSVLKGAAALAAVLTSPSRDKRCVGVILSGGNVDLARYAHFLSDETF